jgi:uncharacterized protein
LTLDALACFDAGRFLSGSREVRQAARSETGRSDSSPTPGCCFLIDDIAISPYKNYNKDMVNQQTPSFEWDANKDRLNQIKHGVPFLLAQYAFADPKRVILEDLSHSTPEETRYYCIGKIGEGILTVRFTYRNNRIRIFGAGYWRKGKQIYEQENKL